MDERYYNPYVMYSPQSMQNYENQMRLENGAVSQYNNNYGHALNNILAQVFSNNVAHANPTPPMGERHPKGFGRPMVMTYNEYKRQYMPIHDMQENYNNYTRGINLNEYLDRLE